ncbi:MAG: chloride channel protein [Clostridia bacterium]|nr:chloride channel protein [Clostridia bacterium]
MSKSQKNYIYHLMFPALIYSFFTGTLVGVVIVLFKYLANLAGTWSGKLYDAMRANPKVTLGTAVFLCAAAGVYLFVYRRHGNLRGGGIPTSIGILRGLIPFNWVHNAVGVFFLSLLTFFIGVPLGTEGPSVQIGTALGRGMTRIFAKKHAAWDRYIMTGGACAGFTAATDAPISGMMFAIEEAHQRISPMIILVSTVSVTASKIACAALSPLLGVSTRLFPQMTLPVFSLSGLWLPVLIAIAVGLFSVVFLKYYIVLRHFWKRHIIRLPEYVRILGVLLLTLGFGLLSDNFLSSGHHMIGELMEGHLVWYLLLAYIVVRSALMIFANSAGITGGMFLPIMALGAMISSVIGGLLITYTPLGREYYSIIVVLGITSCIAGMMKMPLTAVVFAIEALSAHENIIPVLLASFISYFITEIFGMESINDRVLGHRLADMRGDRAPTVMDLYVTVQKDTFAVGKQIRDIFWPANTFVLSVQHAADDNAEMDERGEKTLRAGDRLHVCYSTYNEEDTRCELFAIVGEQEYTEAFRYPMHAKHTGKP